jgi:hypothetical protein
VSAARAGQASSTLTRPGPAGQIHDMLSLHGGSDQMDPQQETVLKKIAWRIVPLLTLAYVANYLDRTNIGFAALTMNKDLGFTATEFGYGAGILFLGYTVFEIPATWRSIGSARGAGSRGS